VAKPSACGGEQPTCRHFLRMASDSEALKLRSAILPGHCLSFLTMVTGRDK
jgi:hypothetical protein